MAESHAPSTSERPSPLSSGRVVMLILFALIIGTLSIDFVFARRNRDTANRRERAEQAFNDPARTDMIWRTNPDGVVQRAVAKGSDRQTTQLIRVHVDRLLLQRRNVGDFGTPAFNGKSMPGRDTLENDAGSITVSQRNVAGGAELTFRTQKPELREALTAWVRAQVPSVH